MIFLAADHAGFSLKEKIKALFEEEKIVYQDLGTFSDKPVDYPPYAKLIARAVIHSGGRGIMFCGTGNGMAIAANRFAGIRAVVIWSTIIARETREDNDANIVSLPARHLKTDEAWSIVRTFLSTTFSYAERHKRRLKQIDEE